MVCKHAAYLERKSSWRGCIGLRLKSRIADHMLLYSQPIVLDVDHPSYVKQRTTPRKGHAATGCVNKISLPPRIASNPHVAS